MPAAVLGLATYPVTIDPSIGPVIPVANPHGGVPAANSQWAPDVAFDGTNFLVVWTDWRAGDNADIYGARVTPTGTVLDPNGLAITAQAEDQERPAVVFGSDRYLIVWEDNTSGHESGGPACC